MRFPVCCTFILSWIVWLSPAVAAAQAVGILPEHHPWGCFKPGAWKRVCVVTETLDEKGFVKNTSTTETKTTLMKVDQNGVTLKLEVVHEVAGKRFAAEPQTIKQGFHGELICQDLKLSKPRPGQVVIEGRKIPCQIIQLECSTPNRKTVTDVYYSATQAPYILKRHSSTRDLAGQKVLNETTVEVVGLNLLCGEWPEIQNIARVRAVSKHPKGTIVTNVLTSIQVPGGVVSHDSKEFDPNQRVVRRSRLRLIAYGSEPERRRMGLFGRRRPSRIHKPKPSPRRGSR